TWFRSPCLRRRGDEGLSLGTDGNRQLIEDLRPARLRAFDIVRQYPVVGEREFAARSFRLDVDHHAGFLCGELGHRECKGETPGPDDLQIFADMLNVLAVAPVNEIELPAG